jgi:hypothetical protein
MSTFFYIFIAIAWALVSVLMGRYIIGTLLGRTLSYKIGLQAILVSYLLGVVLLFVIIANM